MPRTKSPENKTLWELAQEWHDADRACGEAATRYQRAKETFFNALASTGMDATEEKLREAYGVLKAAFATPKRQRRKPDAATQAEIEEKPVAATPSPFKGEANDPDGIGWLSKVRVKASGLEGEVTDVDQVAGTYEVAVGQDKAWFTASKLEVV